MLCPLVQCERLFCFLARNTKIGNRHLALTLDIHPLRKRVFCHTSCHPQPPPHCVKHVFKSSCHPQPSLCCQNVHMWTCVPQNSVCFHPMLEFPASVAPRLSGIESVCHKPLILARKDPMETLGGPADWLFSQAVSAQRNRF